MTHFSHIGARQTQKRRHAEGKYEGQVHACNPRAGGGHFGWDYVALCGVNTHTEDTRRTEKSTLAVTCKKCLAALRKAEKAV